MLGFLSGSGGHKGDVLDYSKPRASDVVQGRAGKIYVVSGLCRCYASQSVANQTAGTQLMIQGEFYTRHRRLWKTVFFLNKTTIYGVVPDFFAGYVIRLARPVLGKLRISQDVAS